MYVLYAYVHTYVCTVYICTNVLICSTCMYIYTVCTMRGRRRGGGGGGERSGEEEEEGVGEGKVSNLSLKDLMVCMWLPCGSRLRHHGNGACVVQGICCMANMWLVLGEGGWSHAPLHGVRRWWSTSSSTRQPHTMRSLSHILCKCTYMYNGYVHCTYSYSTYIRKSNYLHSALAVVLPRQE